jgi:hypothetical protein
MNAVLLAGLMCCAVGSIPFGLLAGLVFAIIPWHGQAILWPTVLHLPVAVFFLLLAARELLNIQANRLLGRAGGLAGLWLLLASLCHEQVLVAVPALVLLAWGGRGAQPLRISLLRSAVLLAVAAAAAVVATVGAPQGLRQAEPVWAPTHVIMNSVRLLHRAAVEHVLITLSGFRTYHPRVLGDWFLRLRAWAICCTLLASGSALWLTCKVLREDSREACRSIHPWPILILLVGAMSIILGSVALLSLSPTPVLENRHLYIPSLGVAVLAAGIARTLRSAPACARRTLIALPAVACLLTVIVGTRTEQWAQAETVTRSVRAALTSQAPTVPANSEFCVSGVPMRIGPAAFTFGVIPGVAGFVQYHYRDPTLTAVPCDAESVGSATRFVIRGTEGGTIVVDRIRDAAKDTDVVGRVPVAGQPDRTRRG